MYNLFLTYLKILNYICVYLYLKIREWTDGSHFVKELEISMMFSYPALLEIGVINGSVEYPNQCQCQCNNTMQFITLRAMAIHYMLR